MRRILSFTPPTASKTGTPKPQQPAVGILDAIAFEPLR
jgi:hypothetical protein